MSLSPEAEALIADRARVWEVRRFCQIANAPSRKVECGTDDHEPHATGIPPMHKGDGALSALLRCLLYELSADIAAVTLLDDRTQYFLSVAQRSTLHDPTITAESSQWYKCDTISHSGGICARTITQDDRLECDDVFEILDLTAHDWTHALPVVDGRNAEFRHYAGVPLKVAGFKIGALYIFKEEVGQSNLTPAHRHYIRETARHAVSQITQTVKALEATRVLRCNSVISSLANAREPGHRSSTLPVKGAAKAAHLHATSATKIYQNATSLLTQIFDLDCAIIQEVPSFNAGSTLNQQRRETLLASRSTSSTFTPRPITDSVADELLETFPSGAVLHLLAVEDGQSVFLATTNDASATCKQVRLDLSQSLHLAEQVVFMPLWDTFHDRNVAFILGGTASTTRVLSSMADLSSLASFGATVMAQVRRLGAQTLERRKADFLGSISHEMRSPLHGILACIDLLLDAESSPAQLDLLQSAESCGLQLRDNIDNLLHYSNIGSPSPNTTQRKFLRSWRVGPRQAVSRQGTNDCFINEPFNFLDLIEESIEKNSRKSKGITPSADRPEGMITASNGDVIVEDGLMVPVSSTTIVIDVDPCAYFPLLPHSGIEVIIDNLLGNCVKFTDPKGCVRVSIDSDSNTATLRFADSGRGISEDFIRHSLFVPFEQQDPLDAGTGLGLSLAHSVVKSLSGEINVCTDQSQGTEVLVTLPRDRLVEHDGDARAGAPQVERSSTDDHSSLTVGLFSPMQWTEDPDPRKQRCMRAFNESLSRTFKSWCNVDLISLPLPLTETEPVMPDIVTILHTDLQHYKEQTGDAYQKTQKIVLCPDLQAQSQVQASQPGAYVAVIGPVCPWKIRAAMSSCSLNMTGNTVSRQADDSALRSRTQAQNEQARVELDSSLPLPAGAENGCHKAPTGTAADSLLIPDLRPLSLEAVKSQREPRFLLVDDNIINLKVVGAYAKKCSKLPSVSAGGGRQAIDAFKHARLKADEQGAFDIILLDLSMPEISGFDVAAAVRELERTEPHLPRTYIAALTGLTSDKDREAAFAAGVSEFITKPAGVKALQYVVVNWRNAMLAQDGG